MRLAHLYAERLGPVGPVGTFGPAWVAHTQRFGRHITVAGAITAAIGIAHPDTYWLATLVAIGSCTGAIGVWHVRNARAISDYGESLRSS